jgi:flagellar motor switch protein FliG
VPRDIDILDPVPAPLTKDMSARTKAAIVVRFLMQEGAEIDLAALPTSLQADLTHEIADLRLIDRIGQSLIAQLDNKPERTFAILPEDRIAAILTAASDDLRDEDMNGLRKTDPELAERVLAGVFTSVDIPTRIAAVDMATALKTVSQTDLVIVLCCVNVNGMEEVSEFILDGLSRRMADTIREEIEERGAVKTKDGEAAVSALASGIQG